MDCYTHARAAATRQGRALRPENQTPHQLELLAKIPIPKGLTPQQSVRLGYLSVVEEGRERGERAGAAIAFRAWLNGRVGVFAVRPDTARPLRLA
jgi:hypothetical protein